MSKQTDKASVLVLNTLETTCHHAEIDQYVTNWMKGCPKIQW